jgi:hypothetical protein
MSDPSFFECVSNYDIDISIDRNHRNMIAEGQNGVLYTFSNGSLIEINKNKPLSEHIFKVEEELTEIKAFLSNCDHTYFLIYAKEGVFVYNFPRIKVEEGEFKKDDPRNYVVNLFAKLSSDFGDPNSITWTPYSPYHFAFIFKETVYLVDIKNTNSEKVILLDDEKHNSIKVPNPRSLCFGSDIDPWIQYNIFVSCAKDADPCNKGIAIITGLIPMHLPIQPKDFTRLCLSLDITAQKRFMDSLETEDVQYVFDSKKADVRPIYSLARIGSNEDATGAHSIYFKNDKLIVIKEEKIILYKLNPENIWTPKSPPIRNFSFIREDPENKPVADFSRVPTEFKLAKNGQIAHVGRIFVMTKDSIYVLTDSELRLIFKIDGYGVLGVGCSANTPGVAFAKREGSTKGNLFPVLISLGVNVYGKIDLNSVKKEIEKRKERLIEEKEAIRERMENTIKEAVKLRCVTSDIKKGFDEIAEMSNRIYENKVKIIRKMGIHDIDYSQHKEVIETAKKAAECESIITYIDAFNENE